MQLQQATPTNRLFSLDVLRGLAAALVLVRHMPSTETERAQAGLVSALYSVGWVGVDLFFVLSGYLIAGLLFKELDDTGRIHLPRFWIRRGFKIWPSYFVAYGGVVLLGVAFSGLRGQPLPPSARWSNFWPNALFIQNYWSCLRWPHSWSLAVEEHFYLALPLVLLALAILFPRTAHPPGRLSLLLPLGFLICVIVLALRLALASGGARWSALYYPSHLRADSLMFGVMLCYAERYHKRLLDRTARLWPWLLPPLLAFTLALVLTHPLTKSPLTTTVGFTFLYLAFGGLVLAAASHRQFGQRNHAMRLLASLGVYSYTVYLAHSVVYQIPLTYHLRRSLAIASSADKLLFIALSIALGVILSHAVERPLLRLRERWIPSHRRSQAALRALSQPVAPQDLPQPCTPAVN